MRKGPLIASLAPEWYEDLSVCAMTLVQVDPEIMSGTPCFAGTRVPVKNLFDYLAHNHPLGEFLEDFPSVSREQALGVLELARERVASSDTRGEGEP